VHRTGRHALSPLVEHDGPTLTPSWFYWFGPRRIPLQPLAGHPRLGVDFGLKSLEGQMRARGFSASPLGYPDCRFNPQPTDVLGGDGTSMDPDLKVLGNYGGPTETMPPEGRSPAMNAIPVDALSADGTIALCPASGTTDQRGRQRPQGPGCEIGAVEVSGGSR